MDGQHRDSIDYRIGDKVRVRSGIYAGLRGIIQSEADGLVNLQLQTGEVVRVLLEQVTNYSLAARRAWEAMPKRAGRPRTKIQRKKMVSLRLDADMWQMLGLASELGLVQSREQVVNEWLWEKMIELLKSA